MEYLEGQALQYVLSRLDRHDQEVRRLYLHAIIQVLSSLHHAHELKDYDGRPLGMVHRDVSPLNVFVLYSGRIKLLDFGVPKAAIGSFDTHTGLVKGKVAYMAPEQAMSLEVDHRVDIYACGVMLWEALAARRLWHQTDDATIIRRLIAGDLPKLAELAPDTAPPLERTLTPRLGDTNAASEPSRRPIECGSPLRVANVTAEGLNDLPICVDFDDSRRVRVGDQGVSTRQTLHVPEDTTDARSFVVSNQ